MSGTHIDLNPIVKNGHFDNDYIESISQQIADVLEAQALENGVNDEYNIKVEKYQELFSKFITEECAKESVLSKFVSEPETKRDGDAATYSFSLYLVAMFDVFGDYLDNAASKDSDFAEFAQQVATMRQEIKSASGSEVPASINFIIVTEKNVLTELIISAAAGGIGADFHMYIESINSTNLNSDSKLDDILNEARDFDLYGGLEGLGFEDSPFDSLVPRGSSVPGLNGLDDLDFEDYE